MYKVLKRAIRESNILQVVNRSIMNWLIILGSISSALYLVLLADNFLDHAMTPATKDSLAVVAIMNFGLLFIFMVSPERKKTSLKRVKEVKGFDTELTILLGSLATIVIYVCCTVYLLIVAIR